MARPSEVLLGVDEGLKALSAVNLDHVQAVEQQLLRRYVGAVSAEKMESVCEAHRVATGCSQ